MVTTTLTKTYRKEITAEGVFPSIYENQDLGVLPQGAPTSPILSNFIAYRLDSVFHSLATKHGVHYSRYADDITFSGDRQKMPSLTLLKNVIWSQGFFVNENKVGFFTQKKRQSVTGITVNKKSTIARKWKNTLHNELYYCVEKGVLNHQQWIADNKGQPIKDNYKDHLYGKICFLKDIEPESCKRYFELFNKIEWPI